MAVDRRKAVEEFGRLLPGDSREGSIEAFGSRLVLLPENFWIFLTESLLENYGSSFDDIEAGLEDAAAECCYHAGHRIVGSKEFAAVLGPMIEEKPRDVLHGAFAVLAAWGWADAEIVALTPAEKMVVHARGYYESEIRGAPRPAAFMLRGMCRALMDLGYGKPYPDGFPTYACRQTRAIELGDPYGEFVVARAER